MNNTPQELPSKGSHIIAILLIAAAFGVLLWIQLFI